MENNTNEVKKESVPEREVRWMNYWKEREIFQKSLTKDAPKGPYVFYDGPPFATGEPHYGHLVGSAMKDCVPRYKTMCGYNVVRQWGWDCHGLPIENIVEKELGAKSKKEIEAMGVKKFNALCREKIFTYVDVWNKFIPRFGRWADMDKPYRTMDMSYMESEWWAFKQLHDKGLIYEAYRSMHICPRCETTLAQSEVAEGYAMVKDISVTASFELAEESGIRNQESGKTYILAWTTTPWTLPGNVALAVGTDIEYAVVEDETGDKKYIVALPLVQKVFEGKGKIVKTILGRDLVGKSYKPLFDYYASDSTLKNRENGWKVYAANFVTTADGTGIVHIAPAFGEDDMNLGKSENLPFVQHVGMDGAFRADVKDFAGIKVKPKDDPQATDVLILKYLAEKGLLFSKEKYEHSYPHCWRCETPLLNYSTGSWFVAVEKIKPELEKYAPDIEWSPTHIKEGRWLSWLSSARDWSISRQRFWANTIPVWRCEKCKKDRVFGSAHELEEASGKKITDLHRDSVDDIAITCECGGVAKRISDVLDTWFDSGSVPFASLHYPFENKEETEKRIPADYIGEGQDQVSKWFYYQHVLAGALFGKRAFTHVIVNGIVLAEDGKKMAKRLRNYPDPNDVVNKYGADSVRLYMLSSPVVRAENLSFSEAGVDELYKKLILRLDNCVSFFELNSKKEEHGIRSQKCETLQGTYSVLRTSSSSVLDLWMIARLEELVNEVTNAMESYELDKAVRPFGQFIDDLSTWYVRRSRDRFKSDDEKDKESAKETLGYVLLTFAKLIAPFAPFVAEDVYQRVGGTMESVHLESWPREVKGEREKVKGDDDMILEMMKMTRTVVTLGLEARARAGIKVRQPLRELRIKNYELRGHDEFLSLVKDEVNVKEVSFDEKMAEDVSLDTTITPELKEEGCLRDLMRAVQDMRKKAGLSPSDKIALSVETDDNGKIFIEKQKTELMKTVGATSVEVVQNNGEEISIGDFKFKISLQKI